MFLSIDVLFLSIDVWYGTVLQIGVIVLLTVLAINKTTRQQNHQTTKPCLSSEVIEANHVVFHTERVEKVEHCLCHHRRTAEIVLAVFW